MESENIVGRRRRKKYVGHRGSAGRTRWNEIGSLDSKIRTPIMTEEWLTN
jgi:hypothetical protein